MEFFYLSPDGNVQKVDTGDTLQSSYTFQACFTENGTVLSVDPDYGVAEINPSDGSLVRRYEEGINVDFIGTAGKMLFTIQDQTLHGYDLDTGKPLDNISALTEQIQSDEQDVNWTTTSSFPLMFLKGDEDNSLFYIDHTGVYRYVLGGSTVEQIINGSLNSLSSPDTGTVAWGQDSDGNFYVGCNAGEYIRIYSYVYSKDTPTTPDTELTVYSLKDSNFIKQAAVLFQKKYPDIDFELVSEQFGKAVPNLISYGTNLMGNLIPVVYSVSMSILKTAINIILGLIISIYMIYSKDKFRFQAKRVVYAVFPEEKGDVLCSTLRECNDIFGAFLISKAIDSLIIGCICCVAMNIIGLPYAVLLSVIVGITNMIPYFGPFIGAVPGVLIFLCTDWELAIVFAIMILIIQQFDGLILGPRLLGQSTGLSPIWVIFAITVGGAYFGVIGMFIGVPVVAVVAYLINKLINSRLAGKDIQALKNVKKSNNS